MNHPAPSFKEQAHALVEQLPENADWKDLAREISILQDIEDALHDSEANRVTDNTEVRKQFSLSP